jgi:hypothetical protein
MGAADSSARRPIIWRTVIERRLAESLDEPRLAVAAGESMAILRGVFGKSAYAPPCGPALLVTQDPSRKSTAHWSGRIEARTGLRMMPTFQAGPSRCVNQLKPAPAYADLRSVCLRPSCFNVDPHRVGSVDAITAPPCGGILHLPQGPSLGSGLFCPGRCRACRLPARVSPLRNPACPPAAQRSSFRSTIGCFRHTPLRSMGRGLADR